MSETETLIAGTGFEQAELRGRDSLMTILPPFADLSRSDIERACDSESGQNVRSTLADALKTAPSSLLPETSDQSKVAILVNPPDEPRYVPLGG